MELINMKHISEDEALSIIKTREPEGLFYNISKDNITNKIVYQGIDNLSGDAWTEEFKSLTACKEWLGGNE